jgi:rRNA-processing protein FCF1
MQLLTVRHLCVTIDYNMRILMDSDCLIKITRAGLKEPTLALFATTCPSAVREEVVQERRPESRVVQENIESGRIAVLDTALREGDDALVEAFNTGGFDVVATDDRRLIRRLDPLGIPCVVPGLLLHELAARGRMSRAQAAAALERLRPMVGADEYQITRFLLEGTGLERNRGREEHPSV